MEANVAIFEQVPAGLEHDEPLVVTMQERQANYENAASMPDFRAFTWVFLVPGFALVTISLIALIGGSKRPEEHDAPRSGIEATEVREPAGIG
jgi:hypothetical protein